jgi:spore coat assembly protein SafA
MAEQTAAGEGMVLMKISNVRRFAVVLLTLILLILPESAFAQGGTHTVAPGDTMWKIAVRYQIGVSELIRANPQIKNPNQIYVGQKVSIPSIDDVKTLEQQVIDLVNKQRAANGLGMLKSNWELCRVARYKSQDMINKGYFSHTSPTYGSPFNMMENFGIRFSAAGENNAYGQRTPQEVMNSWMNSAVTAPTSSARRIIRSASEWPKSQTDVLLDADVHQSL